MCPPPPSTMAKKFLQSINWQCTSNIEQNAVYINMSQNYPKRVMKADIHGYLKKILLVAFTLHHRQNLWLQFKIPSGEQKRHKNKLQKGSHL